MLEHGQEFVFIIAVADVFLAEWMKVINALNRPVRIPNLGIKEETWIAEAIELISKMLCFDPATRLKMKDVCDEIKKIQG